MQRNWIGKSYGATIKFSIINSSEKLEIFTTRPDTIFGATFIAISPTPTCKKIADKDPKAEEFINFVEKFN